MRIIAQADAPGGTKYLVTDDDGPPTAGMVVQLVIPGQVVAAPRSIGSITAHDPYTDWQPATNPPALADILEGVTDWPQDALHGGHRPFLAEG